MSHNQTQKPPATNDEEDGTNSGPNLATIEPHTLLS